MDAEEQIELAGNLRKSLAAASPTGQVDLFETHISYVLLTGEFAYKIKKAVTLDFLDFSTLEKRHFYCWEELRLNQRFSSDLYVDVVPITGTIESPHFGGLGTPIEYAVKMREFPQACLADVLIRKGALLPAHVVSIAQRLTDCHVSASPVNPARKYGGGALVSDQLAATLDGIRMLLDDEQDLRNLAWLSDWCKRELAAKSAQIDARKNRGYVRECHGDLHLGNIAILEGHAAFFDCIEFNDAFRCIDVMSDLAFVVMDLHAHRRRDLCYLLLNTYLELTGDYDGLAVLRLYLVQRALIRWHVALLRREQSASVGGAEASDYLDAAMAWARPARPFMLLMHGLSGSGKTKVSGELMQEFQAVRIRSDVERMRLPQQDGGCEGEGSLEQNRYSAAHTAATYCRLVQLAQHLLNEGFNVIVDACSLMAEQRRPFMALAKPRDRPFAILDVTADEQLMRQRIMRRATEGKDASDADIAVLEQQIRTQEHFGVEESACVVAYVSQDGKNIDMSDSAYRVLVQRLAGSRNPG
jgi:aminoglycoside phosphotransferase family enzyme/predicted kinase